MSHKRAQKSLKRSAQDNNQDIFLLIRTPKNASNTYLDKYYKVFGPHYIWTSLFLRECFASNVRILLLTNSSLVFWPLDRHHSPVTSKWHLCHLRMHFPIIYWNKNVYNFTQACWRPQILTDQFKPEGAVVNWRLTSFCFAYSLLLRHLKLRNWQSSRWFGGSSAGLTQFKELSSQNQLSNEKLFTFWKIILKICEIDLWEKIPQGKSDKK